MNNHFNLPSSVETHFNAANAGNRAVFLSTFAEDARVYDDGHSHEGKEAIKKWSDQTYFEDHLRLEITNAIKAEEEFIVTAKADGDFDKTGLPDPLLFDFHFVLKEDKVASLRIELVEETPE